MFVSVSVYLMSDEHQFLPALYISTVFTGLVPVVCTSPVLVVCTNLVPLYQFVPALYQQFVQIPVVCTSPVPVLCTCCSLYQPCTSKLYKYQQFFTSPITVVCISPIPVIVCTRPVLVVCTSFVPEVCTNTSILDQPCSCSLYQYQLVPALNQQFVQIPVIFTSPVPVLSPVVVCTSPVPVICTNTSSFYQPCISSSLYQPCTSSFYQQCTRSLYQPCTLPRAVCISLVPYL